MELVIGVSLTGAHALAPGANASSRMPETIRDRHERNRAAVYGVLHRAQIRATAEGHTYAHVLPFSSKRALYYRLMAFVSFRQTSCWPTTRSNRQQDVVTPRSMGEP